MTDVRNSTFFQDGIRKVDFVLVQKKVKSEALRLQNYRFVTNLKRIGIMVERDSGIKYPELIFIKLHVPDNVLRDIADIHGVLLTFDNDRTVPTYSRRWQFLRTPITKKPNVQDPIFRRCSETVKGKPNTTFTEAERIMLVHYVLVRTRFGNMEDEYGLHRLLANNNFEDAYPLHDGQYEWSETGPLNDRQILGRFWGNWRMFYKEQPIHVVHKYYGPEIAFHYEWLAFYTNMLILPAILGIGVFFYGFYHLDIANQRIDRVDDVCESDQMVCPSCTHSHCFYKKLRTYCKDARMTFLFDNFATIAFAVCVTIWSTFFLELWQRHENMLLYKWNLLAYNPEIEELPEYREQVKNFVRTNKHTGEKQWYTPTSLRLKRHFVSVSVCLGSVMRHILCRIQDEVIANTFQILFVISSIMFILISIHFVKYYILLYNMKFLMRHIGITLKTYSALMSITLMKIYSPYLGRISKRLTDKEYHRTQTDYLNSFIFKSYILSFVNSYTMLFYNAFFKTISYTHPGDFGMYNKFFGIASDTCPPAVGCTTGLSLHVAFTITKNYILMIITKSYFISQWVTFIKDKWTGKRKPKENLPQWELDYSLSAPSNMFFVQSFIGLVIEYGILTFFVAALPLLPLIALVNNIVELRVSSMKLVKNVKRNVPKRVHGLGAWKDVLMIVTRLSYLISGGVIAFTSTFSHRCLYYWEHGNFKGFVNDTLSEFLVEDYKPEVKDNLREHFPNVDLCYYAGLRNSFNHTEKYQKSDRDYQVISVQLVVVVVFTHFVYFLNGVISFLIPKVPMIIKESRAYDERKLCTRSLQSISEQIDQPLVDTKYD